MVGCGVDLFEFSHEGREIGWIEMVEGNGAAGECRHGGCRAGPRGDPSNLHEMIGEPAAALATEIIIPHPIPARRRMNEPSRPRIDGDMADRAVLREEHQVAD